MKTAAKTTSSASPVGAQATKSWLKNPGVSVRWWNMTRDPRAAEMCGLPFKHKPLPDAKAVDAK